MREYKKQTNDFTVVPEYIENAMQGLAYWIGYKKSLYHYYSLSESATVTEFCSLLQAGLNNNEYVLCERQYSNFFTQTPEGLENKRIDITIVEISKNDTENFEKSFSTPKNKKENGFLKDCAKVVFEVKLLDSPDSLKKEDYKRLKKIKEENKNIITYFLLISENNLPQKYVNEISGKALKDDKIDQCEDYKLHVARVRYALKSKLKTNEMKKSIFKKLNSSENVKFIIRKQINEYMRKFFSNGAYICLIEVI